MEIHGRQNTAEGKPEASRTRESWDCGRAVPDKVDWAHVV